MNRFRFQRIPPRPWSGRYSRVPGDTTALHVKSIDNSSCVVVVWYVDGYTCICKSVDGPDERALAAAVTEAKREMGGTLGGSFQINEYGQVLVPATDGRGQRMLAGRVFGSLRFEDPLKGGIFTLGSDAGLSKGDSWRLPYLGIPYNLSRWNDVYFWREDELGGRKDKPPRVDPELVSALRSVRRFGPVRFLINPEGVILTKKSAKWGPWGSNGNWEAVYVGRVNLRAWFEMEE